MRAGIEAWGREELADPALRPVPPESLHVTLAFLGYRPEKEIERHRRDRRGERAAPAPRIELRDPVPRPPRGRPRLFALPALSPGAEALQAGLEERLVEAGLLRAREAAVLAACDGRQGAARGAGVEAAGGRLESRPGRCRRGSASPSIGVRMTLYRSELQPQGAHYIPLAQVELPGAGRQ